MTPRERLAQLVNAHEGFRGLLYDDANGKPIGPGSKVIGHPTIGYGLALDVRGLTPRQAAWLRDDALDEVEHALVTRLPLYSKQNDPRRMALLELAYQMGVDGLIGPHGFRKMLAALEFRDYEGVKAELLDSSWATQTQPVRVAAVLTMLVDGVWPAEVAA